MIPSVKIPIQVKHCLLLDNSVSLLGECDPLFVSRRDNVLPTKSEFLSEIKAWLNRAHGNGKSSLEINAGDLHRTLGGYPPLNGESHQMSSCCDAMRETMKTDDEIVDSPPKGRGASLTIRYKLPR